MTDINYENLTEEQAEYLHQKMDEWARDWVSKSPGAIDKPSKDLDLTVKLAKFCFAYDTRDGLNLEAELYKNVLWLINRDTKEVVSHILLSWTHPGEFLWDNPTKLDQDLLYDLLRRWTWIAGTAAALRQHIPDWGRVTEFHQQVVAEYDQLFRFFVTDNPHLDSQTKGKYARVSDEHFR